MNKEVKQESSIPVQCRVSVITLADLDRYWESNGNSIKTVSQLISWSLYLLADILRSNKMLKNELSVGEANSYLIKRGLYQKGSMERGYKKISTAIRFEGMRRKGEDPSQSMNSLRDYHIIHKSPTEQFDGTVRNKLVDRAVEIYHRLEKGESVESIKKENELVGGDKIIHEGMSESEVVDKIKSLDSNWEREKREMDEIFKSMSAGDKVSE